MNYFDFSHPYIWFGIFGLIFVASSIILKLTHSVKDSTMHSHHHKVHHPHYRDSYKIKCFIYFSPNLKIGGFNMNLSIEAAIGKLIYGHIDPKDNAGNEVPVDAGSEVYTSTDPTILTVIADPRNPLYFIAMLTGKVGTASIQIALNPDPNAATDGATALISDVIVVTVTPDLATSVNIEVDNGPLLIATTYTDESNDQIVVNQSGVIPEVGDTVTVAGNPIATPTTYTLSDGSILAVDATSKVSSYTAAPAAAAPTS